MAEPPAPPSAPWAAPPPHAWTPHPPKPRRRRPWIYLLVGACVVIAGLAIASATIWIQKVKPPIDAANDYLRDLARGDYEAAFDQLCAAEKVDGSPRSLQETVDNLVFLGLTDYEVSPFDVHLESNRARVEADLNPGVRGTESDFVNIRLRKTDGDWRPCGGRFGFEDELLTNALAPSS